MLIGPQWQGEPAKRRKEDNKIIKAFETARNTVVVRKEGESARGRKRERERGDEGGRQCNLITSPGHACTR